MCLEAILGVITACLLVLKPVFSKIRDSMKKLSGRKGTMLSFKSGNIPILMRVSQIWQSRSVKRTGGEELNSMGSMGDRRQNQTDVQSTSEGERLVGRKFSEIHVLRDVDVESGFGDDCMSVLE